MAVFVCVAPEWEWWESWDVGDIFGKLSMSTGCADGDRGCCGRGRVDLQTLSHIVCRLTEA